MKTPRPERYNNRVIRLASDFCCTPFVFAAATVALFRRLWQRTKSEKVLRAEDTLRQSRARRELRGLPPDHVQE